jgi:nickel superoxide dismutase
MRRILTLAVLLGLAMASSATSHCQIPCGIYDDEARLEAIAENITTIEKAIRQIAMLSEAGSPDYNQIVRWTNVKDEHADDIADIASWYFLQQRVKPVAKDRGDDYQAYLNRLVLLHEILVYSMKTKQSTDLVNVEMLKRRLNDFEDAYLGAGHSH